MKWDVDIYDRPGWNAYTYGYPGGGGIRLQANGDIVVRFESGDASGYNDDFLIDHFRRVTMHSSDGGHSWAEIESPWPYHIPLELSDGTLVEIVDDRQLTPRNEQKARLESLGIGHAWHDDCMLSWDLWPASMTEQLRAEGRVVWDLHAGPTPDQRYLPDDVVATHDPTNLFSRVSNDGGATWSLSKVVDVTGYGHFGCMFGGGAIVLPDDTILVPCYGGIKHAEPIDGNLLGPLQILVLRSENSGKSFELIEVPASVQGYNESCLVYHPSGRVICLLRAEETGCCFSDDGGRTWTVPRGTGIRGGYPLSALALESGAVLCGYAHRRFPGGIRATLSHDAGETWDIDNEKILIDSCLPSSYIGGPGSVQLADGSIFSFYNLVKPEVVRDGDIVDLDRQITLTPRWHSYIAGSCYTEDYIRTPE